MPRRKQEQPQRLPSHVDRTEGGAVLGGSEEDGWFGNASDSPSESSYGDIPEELRVSPENGPQPEQDASSESSVGCPTPVHRASLELLGLDARVLTTQDTLSSVVSSLYSGDAAQGLGKPLSSNLRRLLEAGSLKLEGGELIGRGAVRGAESPPVGLALSPSSRHAQQLSALARRLAGNSASAPPASVPVVKQEPSDPFSPAEAGGGSGGAGFMWVGMGDAWLAASCSGVSGSSLSPDSAIQKLKAAANAVLQDKGTVTSSGSASSSSSSSSSSVTSSSAASSVAALGGRPDDAMRFDAFTSPFSSQSASSTLAALSKKVSERSQQVTATPEHPPTTAHFLSLVSMTSSAALLKEVAARAAGNLLVEKKESPAPLTLGASEDVKPLLDRNQKVATPSQTMDILLPSTPKGRGKPSSQAGSPEDVGKPFQCPVCGLVIKRKSYWKRHMVIHTGLKSHQCPLCPFRCARKDNLKSHMKVHQHQDRGETFQCELCPFTSSRHFSLKLHMRCHQHFPRPDLKVKEEPCTDTEEGEGDGSLLGDITTTTGDQAMTTEASLSPALPASPSEPSECMHVKEEPLDVAVTSPFTLRRDRPGSSSSLDLSGRKASPSGPGPAPGPASLFSPDITTKTATDLLMKLSAANQKEALKGAFLVKEEPQAEEPQSSPRGPAFCAGPSAHQEGSPLLAKGAFLSQDIHMKVASELLMKLSENKKDTCLQKVTVKAEPMDVDTPPEVAPPPSHLLGFSTLGACEKKESLASISEPLPCPQKDLFSQDISVKMASELLFKLSEKVSKANENKDSAAYSINSPFLDDHFRQSPFSSRSKSSSPAEASSSARAAHQQDLEKALVEVGNGVAPWTLSEQLYPCSVCGKVFGRQQTLSRHLSLHTEERRYKCHLCPYAAKCRANLNQHLSIHSVKLVSTEAEHIVTAVTADRGERRNCPFYYSCRVCGFQTELNAQFVSHMSLHVDKEQWMFSLCCSLCEYVGVDETEIKAHINTEHAGLNSRSPLSESKSTSSSLSALSDSLNSSEGGDVTQGNDELKILLAPPSSASSQSSSASGMEDKSEKGFECVFCNFVCKTRSMYERHLQIHLIARMFECDVCHKFMKTPEQLLEHKKCHAVPTGGLKSAALGAHLKTHCRLEFRCRICQAVWASQAELDRHVRAHRLGNHYKCEQCGYLSKTANKLIEHVRVHTGERPFHCDRCAYSCKRKDNLNLHKRLKHAPRQTFGCRRCAFTTTHPFVYSRHVKKHQGGEGGGEEGEAQQDPSRLGSAHDAEPLFLLEGDGSRGLSASQALQSVAMSVSCRRPEGALAPHYLSANGASAPTTTPAARCCEQYKNYDPAHLIPLTMLFNTQRCTFHNPAPSHASSPFSRLWPRPSSRAPPSPLSPKRSFLAYLGLTVRAKTI
ncbi:LOW QUALITY PROTEIN: zinc finger protein 827 [Electrophorus electricus]|uniref:LOW QUALITY PROTEIN: zinc finger protein 827 n=1 Tax=Electrophorus electricus TaxID=8005 RepID=UPI0015D04460|nr:LOW QUALITY PROTEIN: zinc finger protein 827 [Electrophorus electricus]